MDKFKKFRKMGYFPAALEYIKKQHKIKIGNLYSLDPINDDSIHSSTIDNKYLGDVCVENKKIPIKHEEFIALYTFNDGYFEDSNIETAREGIEYAFYYRKWGNLKDNRLELAINLANTYIFSEANGPPEHFHYKTMVLGFIPKIASSLKLKDKKIQKAITELMTERKEQLKSLEKLLTNI